MTLFKSIRRAAAATSRMLAGTALGLGLAVAVAAAPQSALAEEQPSDGPALWVVSDHDSTIYLFGTVHLLRPETVWRTPRIEAALNEADTLWLEMAEMDDQAVAAALTQQYGLNLQGPPLSTLLTDEENAVLDETLGVLGVPAAAKDMFQPWLAGLYVSVASVVRAGYSPTSGVDLNLKNDAQARDVPVRGFETMEQQFRFFHDLPQETQLESLRQSLSAWNDGAELLDRMVELWSAGDVEGFNRVVVEEMRTEWGDLYDVLLVRRNADWVGQIEAMLEGSGVTFIAVGAAHLAGDDSVQRMLEARGITVTRR